jgi:hypothetical protein
MCGHGSKVDWALGCGSVPSPASRIGTEVCSIGNAIGYCVSFAALAEQHIPAT